RLTNYTGVVNYLGARFTSEPAALEPVIADLGERGLLYLDDGTSSQSKADVLAVKNRAAFAAADGVIDEVQDKNEILKALDGIEATARAKGSAIAMGTGFDVTIVAVNEWVKEAKKRGIEVVGVSALATDPEQ
ncbi:MAG: divergent polysaccharide deacetylase family protein, partial [Rhizobiaceae bacterium]